MSKNIFDFLFSFFLLFVFFPILFLLWFFCTIDTSSNGIFFQTRVGQYGKLFKIFKLKTVNPKTVKISNFGCFLRKSKLDELPQLLNILLGQMSFVGPRPDLEGYYNKLEGENRKILELKPGLTSLASIKYANEEELLSKQNNPSKYNDEIIFPDKVKMNLDYYYNRTFNKDLKIIFKTIFRNE